MFDSDNIPLVVRVENGPGISLSYIVNSEGHGVYRAKIDSDYIGNLVKKEQETTVVDGLDVRLVEVENLLGILAQRGIVPTTVDSDILNTITYSQTGTLLTGSLKFRFEILSFDRNSLISKDITISAGTNVSSILNVLAYTVTKFGALNYLEFLTLDDTASSPKLKYGFKPQFSGFLITINVTQTSDKSVFTVN